MYVKGKCIYETLGQASRNGICRSINRHTTRIENFMGRTDPFNLLQVRINSISLYNTA
jgi:hypothetical protein